jgi:hypothetical protein
MKQRKNAIAQCICVMQKNKFDSVGFINLAVSLQVGVSAHTAHGLSRMADILMLLSQGY